MMWFKRKRLWFGTGAFVTVGLLGVAALDGHSVGDIPAGTGYSAWELCSRTMQGSADFEQVRTQYVEPKVNPLQLLWDVEHVPGARVGVRTRLPLLSHPRTAVFRAGRGCTLAPPGTDEAALRAQPFVAAPVPPVSDAPWPSGEGKAEAGLLDARTKDALERHGELIFDQSAADPRMRPNVTSLLVARGGHLLYERYGQGGDRSAAQLGWSMTKTLTAMLAGVLAQDGKLALDAAVGLPSWKGTPKEEITWRHLLNMAPGLAWFEGYGGASDATQMLFSEADQGGWAAARPLTSKPGSVFTYSTGSSNIAMLRMRQLLGGEHQGIYDYYQQRLFAPLGIRDAVIEADASGTPVGGARGMLRAVDWLRLGQLLMNGGRWKAQSIIPADYVAYMFAPSPASDDYGGSLWRLPSEKMSPEIRARLPDDTVWFAGHLAQYVVMVPSRDLLIVRTGVSIDEMGARDRLFAMVADLSAAD